MGMTPRQELHGGHRPVSGGLARAAVFGINDGLVSNVSLILGFAGSGVDSSVVRLAGLAGAIAGGISMAAGEWISVSAQNELVEREVAVERRELARNTVAETAELAAMYEVARHLTRHRTSGRRRRDGVTGDRTAGAHPRGDRRRPARPPVGVQRSSDLARLLPVRSAAPGDPLVHRCQRIRSRRRRPLRSASSLRRSSARRSDDSRNGRSRSRSYARS